MKRNSLPVIVLCGGRGIRLASEPSYIPKGMVYLGHQPVLWHVMKRYALFGHNRFVLALGPKGEMIRDYFLNYESYTNDVEFELGARVVKNLTHHQENNWGITLVDTGVSALSGARLWRTKDYVSSDEFMISYSDSVANVDFDALLAFHRKHKKIMTVTGVIPPYRALEFKVDHDVATGFYDVTKVKPGASDRYINGGYMICNKDIFSYVSSYNECQLETEVFSKLIADKQLAIYPHHGFWRWLDTDRDYEYLRSLVDDNKMYWLKE